MNTRILTVLLLVFAFPGLSSAILISPNAYDFGEVQVGDESRTTLTIGNDGVSDLVVDSIDFYNGGAANYAVLTQLNFPHAIAAGDSVSVEIAFRPAEIGEVTARVLIRSNDFVNPAALVPCTGTGTEQTQVPPADPSINGEVNGIELCPKFICGNALFAGFFSGDVGGKRAFGTWFAAINHEDLPTDPPIDPDGVIDGEWTLRTWVFQGWFPSRKRFSGDFERGSLENLGGNFYQALVPMTVTSGGTGRVNLDLLLDENTFPQPVTGTLTTPIAP